MQMFNLYLEKKGGKSISFFAISILSRDHLLVNSRGGAFRSFVTLPDYCVTKITFATSPISMHFLQCIVVQLATSLFQQNLKPETENWKQNLERHLILCKKRTKRLHPRNAYLLREILFNKLDFFSIPYSNEHQSFINFVIFDFESTCVRE